jgi:hypothetical protein
MIGPRAGLAAIAFFAAVAGAAATSAAWTAWKSRTRLYSILLCGTRDALHPSR